MWREEKSTTTVMFLARLSLSMSSAIQLWPRLTQCYSAKENLHLTSLSLESIWITISCLFSISLWVSDSSPEEAYQSIPSDHIQYFSLRLLANTVFSSWWMSEYMSELMKNWMREWVGEHLTQGLLGPAEKYSLSAIPAHVYLWNSAAVFDPPLPGPCLCVLSSSEPAPQMRPLPQICSLRPQILSSRV